MSADVAARLRQLAHDHHDGRLDLATYRSLRAPLLESLVPNGGVALAVLENTQPRAVPKPATPVTNEPESKGVPKGAIAIAAVAVVLVVVLAGLWALRGSRLLGGSPGGDAGRTGSRTDSVTDGGAAGAPGSRATAEGLNRILDLVGSFIDRGDWSDGRLATLNASLLEVGGAQIAAATHEARFQRFIDELRARLKEQQALAPARLTADNSPLAALAVAVGIDLNSPDSALHIAPLPAPPPPAGATEGARGDVAAAGVRRGAGMGHPLTAPAGITPPPGTTPTGSGSDSPLPAGQDVAGGSAAGAAAITPVAAAASATAAASGADTQETTCRIDLIRSRRPLCHDTLPPGVEGPLLALIPAGSFDMGSTAAPEEQPVHHVTIHEPFAISVYEVSQGEFKHYCEQAKRPCAPQPWAGDDYPVVNVSWDDARTYTEWLSGVTHHRYSLPTEAQWEYAARAGRTGLFPTGDALSATDAQFSGLTKQAAAARRSQSFNANAFRLLHTVGNVREWVDDSWIQNFVGAPSDGSAVKSAQVALHVVRGGSYTDGATRLRLSMREGLSINTRDATTGFRIVRELP
ncbi:MAG: serine/threonine protein kinase PpkA [Gammaproteobacteria bacterium]|nr:serine/threonine protein kinase PpkA [Gammaproteobacteria bacterium]